MLFPVVFHIIFYDTQLISGEFSESLPAEQVAGLQQFSWIWVASAPLPGSIIGCYRRLVERHRRSLAREYHAFINQLPVTA